jgi:hypothetical protein
MLLLASLSALPAEAQLPFDSRPLVEVHTLDAIPKEVIALLRWHRGGPDGIAERFDKFNATNAAGSPLPSRLLETAGVSSAAVVVIYRQAGQRPTYHAVAFMMGRTGWSRVCDWTLDERPGPLLFFLYAVDTARYRFAPEFLRQQRHIGSKPGSVRRVQFDENAPCARPI